MLSLHGVRPLSGVFCRVTTMRSWIGCASALEVAID